MAQLIRKFSTGGASDPAPLKALGNYYNVDEFRREMLGPKADAYIEAMGFNSSQAAQFRKDLQDHVDEIIAGTMHVTDNNTLANSSGNWENDGEYKRKKLFKWKLSDDEKRNNRSIDVTNYILGTLNANAVKQYAPSGISYSLNFDDLFKDRMHPSMAIEDYWETWDALDHTSEDQKDAKGNVTKKGEKGTKNRLKHIADLLVYEADRLDNDVNYRNESTWNGWQTKWDGRQLETSKRLRAAASKLYDGVATPEDTQFLMSIGVNLPMYLDPEKRKKSQVEAAQPSDAAPADASTPAVVPDSEGALDPGNDVASIGFTTTYKPWEKKQYSFVYNGKTYTGSQINQLESNSDLTDYFKDFQFEENHSTNGYKYILDLTEMLGQTNSTRMYLKDKYDRRNAVIMSYDPTTKKFHKVTAITPHKGGYKLTLDINNKKQEVIPTKQSNPVVSTVTPSQTGQTLSWNDANPLKSSQELTAWLRKASKAQISAFKAYKAAIKKYIAYIPQQSALNSQVKYDNKNYQWYQVPIGGGKHLRMYGGLSLKNGKLDLNYDAITNVVPVTYDASGKAVPVWKEGGKVLKAQSGYTLQQHTPMEPYNIQSSNKSSRGGRTNAAIGYDEREKQKETQEITGTDLARLGLSLVDLSSVAAAFVPGLHVASTATGAAASIGEFGADMVDWIHNRDGVSFWESVGRLGLNLGMDVISLAPALKTVKGGSALRKVAKVVPHIAGAIQTYNLIADDELRASVGRTLTKIKNLDVDALDTQDFKNIAYLGRTLLAAKNVKNSFKKGSDTGNVKVQGKVKVDGEYKTVEVEMPKDALPSMKGRQAAAQKALAAKANEMYGRSGETSIKPEDVSVKTSFGRTYSKTVRTEMPAYGPKKVFEGWFGSDGLNWRYSDYNLAMTNPYVARLYGLTPQQSTKKDNRITDESRLLEAHESPARRGAVQDKVSENVKKPGTRTDSEEKINDIINPKNKTDKSDKIDTGSDTKAEAKSTSDAQTTKITDKSRLLPEPKNNLPALHATTSDAVKQQTLQSVNAIIGNKVSLPNLQSIVGSNTKVPTVSQQLAVKVGQKNKPKALPQYTTETKQRIDDIKKVAKQYKGSRKDVKNLNDRELLEKYPTTKQVRQKASKKVTKQQRASKQKAVQDNLNELYAKYGAAEYKNLNVKQKKDLAHKLGLNYSKQKKEIELAYGKQLLKHAMPSKLDKLAKDYLGRPLYPSYRLGGQLSYNLIKKLQGGGTPGVDYIEIDGIKYPIKGNESYFQNSGSGYLTFNIYNKDKKQSGYDFGTGLWHKFDGDKEATQIWDGSKFVDYNDDNKWQYKQGTENDTDQNGLSVTPWETIPNLQYYSYYGAKPTDVLSGSKGQNGTKGLSSEQLTRDANLYDDKGNLKEDMSVQAGIDRANEYFSSGKLTQDATNYLQSNTGSMSMQNAIDMYNQNISYLNNNRKDTFANNQYAYSNSGGRGYNTSFNSVYTNYPGGYDADLEDGQGTAWGQRFVYKTTGGDDPTVEGFDQNRIFEANGVKLFVKEDGTIGKVDPNQDTNFYYTNDQFNAMLKGKQNIDYNKLTAEQQALYKQEYPDLSRNKKKGFDFKFNTEPFLSSVSQGVSNSFNLATTNIGKDLAIAKKQMPVEGPGLVFGNYDLYNTAQTNKAKALASAEGLTANGRDYAATLINIHKTYDPVLQDAKRTESANIRTQMKDNHDNAVEWANARIDVVDDNLALDVAKVNYGKGQWSNFVSQLGNNLKGGIDEIRTNYANTRVAQQKLAYEQGIKDASRDYSNAFEADLIDQYGTDAVNWYKQKYNLSNVTPTKSVIDEYARHNTSIMDGVEKINSKHRSIYESKVNALGKQYAAVPTFPWEFDIYDKVYDFNSGKWVRQAKKGTKLTKSEKNRIEKVKAYNKQLESTYKEQMKNIRKDIKTYRAQQRTNAAGSLHLLKKATR